MIGCLRARARKQPIIALYFEFENGLNFITSGPGPNFLLKKVSEYDQEIPQSQVPD